MDPAWEKWTQEERSERLLDMMSLGSRGPLLDWLMDHTDNINAQDAYLNTPLMHAAHRGYVDEVRKLIAKGAALDVQDVHGVTALITAVKQGANIDIVDALLSSGANVSIADNLSYTPLMWAAWCDRPGIAEVIVRKSGGLEARDMEGFTPLMLAIYHGHVASVKCLLELGADIFTKTDSGLDAPALARARNERALADYLSDVIERKTLERSLKDGIPLDKAVSSVRAPAFKPRKPAP